MKQIATKNRKISLEETTSLLGVSSATVRNWIRHNYLVPEDTKNLFFDYPQVIELKDKINNGEIDRLNRRANKRNSNTSFIPEEYADNQKVVELVEQILAVANKEQLNQNTVIYFIALILLRKNGNISFANDLSDLKITNPILREELNWWVSAAKNNLRHHTELLDLEIPEVTDLLGLIYQSLVAEGNKAQAGSYYTPKVIVENIVQEYVTETSTFLDPCCGTGQFLLCASSVIKNPSNIWGFDIDEVAVRIARINLILRFPDDIFYPNVYHRNTLLELNDNQLFTTFNANLPAFDVVATNPPWGVHLSKSETGQLKKLFPDIKSNETFSYFIKKGVEFLKEGGILSYILPEAILNIKTHRDIRFFLLNQTTLKKIRHLNRVFKNVFTPVIRMDLAKIIPSGEEKITATNGTTHKLEQDRLKNNPDYIFDVFNKNEDWAIFDKVYSLPFKSLSGNADWALGVVTGNNEKYLVDNVTIENEPIFTGKEVKRFVFAEPRKYIKFVPEDFQQVAPEHKYRAPEKLVYKFISKELVFSYDDTQALTLNSANILIPKVPNYPVKTILALLNSSLYQFLYQKKFGAIKILKSDLEKLPLPEMSETKHESIKLMINQLLERGLSENKRMSRYQELDEMIMSLFDLNTEEKTYVFNNIKVSVKSLNIK